jgi:hypothetical protein
VVTLARSIGSDLGGTPVSPPGKFSQRTDMAAQPKMDLPDAQYGEAAQFDALQGAAPMAAKPQPVKASPLRAPSARPDEPVTAGAPFGPGDSMNPPTSQNPSQLGQGRMTEMMRRVSASDPSGDSERLLAIVERLGW